LSFSSAWTRGAATNNKNAPITTAATVVFPNRRFKSFSSLFFGFDGRNPDFIKKRPDSRLPEQAAAYNNQMPKSPRSVPSRYASPRYASSRYTAEHASAGLNHNFPEIETWPNQFLPSGQSGYEIVVDDPEFTSVCPKTGLPDFGNLVIRYEPDRLCLELKSLKEYLQTYRNLGIFQENVVNRVLEDVVRWAKPVWAEVKGEFRPRGGISTVVIARWPRAKKGKK
jgi:7-cyano-7-deazaguanine reductase